MPGALHALLSRAMAIDTALTFLSLLSFAALIVLWFAAPLHAEDATQASSTEAPAHTVAA